ncbi:hypothetical protein Patl1_35093 [Pistacia atlantica]|uniref:Uncharacterized protein n=1 Tax=Pistacia atlantica TaxID=434234 RepID=A0ACC0ZNG3_9ROSI|nr:hypothetical protein Patl1_35093 [Pistacia atlantica]
MAEANAIEEKSVTLAEGDESEKSVSRKEKRKLAKKKKRKEKRREIAEKEREEAEVRANDPEERRKLEMMAKEAEEERKRALKEFEERERIWIREMEMKKEEEERWKMLEQEREEEEEIKRKLQVEKENECSEDDDWEYVEEGPAEIIWQGNEIIIRKKKVRVPKKDVNHFSGKDVGDVDRPTSNPLPPQTEVFADYQNAQQALENVARQVPNFGTEQDKAHCPFHLKTGVCRFGQSCSRVHFYPDKSCTLLIKNMYNGPGLAWEQDEGLEVCNLSWAIDMSWVLGAVDPITVVTSEHFDSGVPPPYEEVESSYEEFYEDVHTEFLKFGEIVNFKVCKNGSFHLKGNVYVHYMSLESAVDAYHSVNGRYFAGKQVKCEFVNVTRWKLAICGEYMKSRLKTCSRGMACNFIHCFRNPGGDYEWADWDKPPPKYWAKKMAALFGYTDDIGYWKQMDEDFSRHMKNSNKINAAETDSSLTVNDRLQSQRSKSREMDRVRSVSRRSHDGDEDDVRESTHSRRNTNDNRKRIKLLDYKFPEESSKFKDYYYHESRSDETSSDGSWSDRERDRDRDRHCGHTRKSRKRRSTVSEKSSDYRDTKSQTHEADSDWSLSDGERNTKTRHVHAKRSSRYTSRWEVQDNGDSENRTREDYGERDHSHTGKRSRVSDRCRTLDPDSGDDLLDRDKERHCSHERKRSRKGDAEHKHSSRKSHSRKESSKSKYRHSKSNEDHESSSSDEYDERRKTINKNDRWKLVSPEEDRKSRRKTTSVQSHKSDSPGRYNGISKSQDLNSEYCYNEMINGGDLESKEDKSRGKSRSSLEKN